MLAPVWDRTVPGLLVLVATNPVVSHGYGTTLPDPVATCATTAGIGGRIWVIDPRRTETAALADEHLAVRPGSDVALLAALARELLADGADPTGAARAPARPTRSTTLREALAPFTVERAARACRARRRRGRTTSSPSCGRIPGSVAINCGTGATMSADGVLVEWLRWVLLILSGSLDRPGGVRFHDGALGRLRPPRPPRPPAPGPASRPSCRASPVRLPAVALVDEIEAGNVRVLVVTGGNPIGALPEPERVRARCVRSTRSW